MRKFFRILGLIVVTFFLVSSMFFLANAFVFNLITSKPEKIKQIAADSQVYQKLPGVIYDNVAKENKDPKADVNLQDPEVKAAFLSTLTPEFFKTNVEMVVDGTYVWLDGKTPQPEFALDFSQTKAQLVNSIVDLETKRAEQLPKCTLSQIRELKRENIDIFNLECIPPGVDVASEAKKAKAELASTSEFLEQTKFSASDIKDENGQSVFNQASNAPNFFKWLKRLPFLAIALVALFSWVVFVLSQSKKQGLTRLGVIYIIGGILVAAGPLLASSFISNLTLTKATDFNIADEILKPLLSEYIAEAASIYYVIGVISIVLGIAAIVYATKKLSDASQGSLKQ